MEIQTLNKNIVTSSQTLKQVFIKGKNNLIKIQERLRPEGDDLNTAKYVTAGGGTQTAALNFGGDDPGGRAESVESYDGSSWTEEPDLNSDRYALGGAGDSNTSALAFGGYPSPVAATTESFDGTSWTELADLSTGRQQLAGTGSATLALAAGGNPSQQTVEEWSFATSIETVSFD